MEVEEIQAVQACKFSRVGNGRNDSNKVGTKGGTVEQYQDDEEDGDAMRVGVGGGGGGGLGFCGGTNEDDGTVSRLRGWQHSSRIFRVSRASGGKDRHSKVLTSKGLRDRRVRLSVSTAIAFYDLQDRLGVDQPSKAVEWLIKAAAEAIAELPSLSSSFPDQLKQLSEPKQESTVAEQGFDSADVELDGDPNYQHQQQQLQQQLSKSACSSTSETSKCSSLSLSRSELRVNRGKARERARERAKEKEKEKESESRIGGHQQQLNVNPISQNSSFTELLTAGFSTVSNNTSSTTASAQGSPGGGNEPNFFQRARHWPATPMDYFTTGLFGGASSSSRAHLSSGFLGQMGNSQPQSMAVPPFSLTTTGDSHHELQHFSFVPDHLIPVTATTQQPGGSGGGGNDSSLNFTISSGGLAAGYNRGTLQSNSPSPLPHLQRFSPIDGSISNAPFFFGTVAPASTSASLSMENNHLHYHPFSPGFDARLQLCHGDGTRHSDQKGKGKN